MLERARGVFVMKVNAEDMVKNVSLEGTVMGTDVNDTSTDKGLPEDEEARARVAKKDDHEEEADEKANGMVFWTSGAGPRPKDFMRRA